MTLERTLRIGLSPHADLKSRAEGEILVLPEQAIRVGGSGAEILRLVERGTTVGALLKALRRRYPDSPELEAEVIEFLEGMLEARGVVILDERGRKARSKEERTPDPT